MITGNESIIKNIEDLSHLGITFSSKPTIMGGLAMEHYGLRKRGMDIDFIISNEDYQVLAKKYPNNKKDKWGDLGLLIGQYELFRSVARLDYDFYSEGAIEYDKYKVMSFEKLFFMKVIAYKSQPEILKHTNDFELMIKYYYETFRNKDYVENAIKHIEKYETVPDGTIFNDNY
ncbi:MAG TPA: hypothetical protein VIK78_09085 [Ruminiclostridium sp.]